MTEQEPFKNYLIDKIAETLDRATEARALMHSLVAATVETRKTSPLDINAFLDVYKIYVELNTYGTVYVDHFDDVDTATFREFGKELIEIQGMLERIIKLRDER